MAEWEESLHPRASGPGVGGQFTFKGSGSAPTKTGHWALDADDHREIAQYRLYTRDNPIPDNVGELRSFEHEAIKNYAGTGKAMDLNVRLRGLADGSQELNNQQHLTMMYLDDIMKRATLAENTILFRAYGLSSGSSFAEQFEAMEPGASFTDPAFMSTAFNREFVGSDNVIKILAPAGSHALVVPRGMDFEHEVILARNSTLEFVGDDEDRTKIFRLRQDSVNAQRQ